MNLNKAILIGRVTRDPEMRTTSSGQNVSQFGLATNRVWNNNQGERQESTEFHNVVAWGRLAEIVGNYVKKGTLVMVEGRIQTRSWQGQDGTTKYKTEVVCENLQLGPRSSNQGGGNYNQNKDSSFSGQEQKSQKSTAKAEDETPTINLDDEGNPVEENDDNNQPPDAVMPF